MSPSVTAAELRGGLPLAPPGAADLFKSAELAACPARALMTLCAASPADVALTTLSSPTPEGQSPLAITRGLVFERSLRADDAARLRGALREAGLPWTGPLLDVERAVPLPPAGHGRAEAVARREALTLRAVRDHAGRERPAPAIVWQPSLTVAIDGAEFRLRPDLLLARDDGAYSVGEIKSYPDRGPLTDPADVAGALGQAAVGMLALEQAAAGGHGAGPHPDAVLVLARAGTARPAAHAQPPDRERAVLAGALDALPASARAAVAAMPEGTTLADPDGFLALPTEYGDRCRSRCALAAWCRRRAADDGSLAALGDAAAGAFPGLALPRAAALASGRVAAAPGDPPSAARAATAGAALRRAMPRQRRTDGAGHV